MVMIMKIKAKNGDDYAEEGYKWSWSVPMNQDWTMKMIILTR